MAAFSCLSQIDAALAPVRFILEESSVGARFNTYAFILLFLPITLVGYWVLRGQRTRLAWLTLASFVFYSLYDWRFSVLLLVTALSDYLIAIRLERATGDARRLWLGLSVCLNLGLLGFFKYALFAAENLQGLAALAGLDLALPLPRIVLPVGISFFVFKTLSYTIDVYRREQTATRDPLLYLAFISLFPELVAGPIVRYSLIAPQLQSLPSRLSQAAIATGVGLFAVGLAKKTLVADPIAAHIDPLWAASGSLTTAQAWEAALGYTFQLYFDFSGYSDMAIGLACLLGLSFPVNFRAPYRALDPSDFWRRWHVTLSQFLRDYLYIPLGGNRRGPARTMMNLFVVMLLGGLWHGAAWTFVAWGAFHGLLLVAYHRWGRAWDRLAVPVRWAGMMLAVVVGWVIFRATTLAQAGQILARMTFDTVGGGGDALAWIAGGALVAWVLVAKPSSEILFRPRPGWAMATALLFTAAFLAIGTSTSPFLYYQF